MDKEKFTSISVSKETQKKLFKIKGKLLCKSYDAVILKLIKSSNVKI